MNLSMEKLMSKLRLKNKKVYLIFIVIILILLFIILPKKKELKFSKYATVKVDNICEFNNQINSDVHCTFEIINLSENPFVITEIIADKEIDFLNTRIRKLIPQKDTTYINTKFKTKIIGLLEKKIIVKSNARRGDISLILKGIIQD